MEQLVDGLSTNVLEVEGKQLVKVVAWYDNEMGYSTQMVRTAKYLMKNKRCKSSFFMSISINFY